MGDEYRATIYEKYASRFQDAGADFDTAAARKRGKAYDYYLRGWLPKERDAHIAELACGGGRLLHFFKERGYTNLEGIDISPEQVVLARQVISHVSEGDAIGFLEANKERFFLLVALDLLEHLRKDETLRFLRAAHDALADGGSLILQTPNAATPWFGDMRYNDFTHEVCFSSNSIRRLLLLTHFINIEPRETGPVPLGSGLTSLARFIAWKGLRELLKLWNLIEMGTPGDGIYTRNMLVRAQKAK
jgi:SAM-dependent methyltransferase